MREIYAKAAVRATALNRRAELDWTLAGIVFGMVVGFIFGGIGIAGRGDAIGVWGFVAGAVVLGLIGNRIGTGRDRAALARKASGR
ncbi:hypothetical protein Sa4125_30010 [Aureimonas sp. SA4125]|uniref:hypothetical protein n=1 Tax=Aureimonas sp. SA4125 TaxID=2826993 RepID=UPI001CC773AD|nr:hypothetical protein [Aureimonas sp. SA4125]BDA85459.1 hypothetical protein Sa4125_30010 [Aureimonas sp. SA4125]